MSVILMYHRVADLPRDPYGLAVHPDRFAAHVEHLVRLESTVRLQDVVGRDATREVVVTFDDGYADNATVAAPVLEAAGLPATWFITAGRLGRRRFWWDKLAEVLLGPPGQSSLDVEIAGQRLWLDLASPEAQRLSLQFVHRRLRPLPPDELEAEVDWLVERVGLVLPDDSLTMTVDQLRGLAARPDQEIGAHTRTHLQLRGQTEELQRAEVLGSVADLSELLQRPVRSFAYPFGSPGAVGELAPRLAEEAGCHRACSTLHGAASRDSERFLLPRLNVQDWDAAEFAGRLDALLGQS